MVERYLTPRQKAASLKIAKESKLCRWCGGDVHRLSPKRRTFCSDECVHEFNIRSSSSYIRTYIGKRDKYTCQICQLDCKGFMRRLWRYVNDKLAGVKYSEWTEKKKDYETEFFHLHNMDWVNTSSRSTFYDIDHIHPVVKGGHQCGEENLRVVCLSCHRKETAKLRAEMKKS